MARITLSNLAHSYFPHPKGEADFALKEMDHVWEDGGAYALLGSSGCGILLGSTIDVGTGRAIRSRRRRAVRCR